MSSSSFGFRAIISVSSNELGSVPFFSIFLEESIVSWMLLKSFLPPRTLWGLKKFHTLSLDFVVFSSIGKTSVFKVRRPRIGTHFHFTCYMTLNKLFKSWDNHFLFILFFLFLFLIMAIWVSQASQKFPCEPSQNAEAWTHGWLWF